jgi:hypothetical protein
MHFTPISGPWLNLVEMFLGITADEILPHARRHQTSDSGHRPGGPDHFVDIYG